MVHYVRELRRVFTKPSRLAAVVARLCVGFYGLLLDEFMRRRLMRLIRTFLLKAFVRLLNYFAAIWGSVGGHLAS